MQRVIRFVRQESAAGWFMGAVEFSSDNVECFDKDEETCYYVDEASLAQAYPHSISMKEACDKAKHLKWITWGWER